MMFGIRTWQALRRRGIMGINQRNSDYVLRHNARRLYPLVDDKIRTTNLALDANIRVPDKYAVIRTARALARIEHIAAQRGEFVIKPAPGPGGAGVRVSADPREACDP